MLDVFDEMTEVQIEFDAQGFFDGSQYRITCPLCHTIHSVDATMIDTSFTCDWCGEELLIVDNGC